MDMLLTNKVVLISGWSLNKVLLYIKALNTALVIKYAVRRQSQVSYFKFPIFKVVTRLKFSCFFFSKLKYRENNDTHLHCHQAHSACHKVR